MAREEREARPEFHEKPPESVIRADLEAAAENVQRADFRAAFDHRIFDAVNSRDADQLPQVSIFSPRVFKDIAPYPAPNLINARH